MWNLFICSDTYKIQDKHKNKRFSHNASFSLGWRKTHYIDVALNFWSPFPASQGAVMKTRPLSISLKNIKLSYLIYVNVFPAWMYMHQRHACCWLMNDRSEAYPAYSAPDSLSVTLFLSPRYTLSVCMHIWTSVLQTTAATKTHTYAHGSFTRYVCRGGGKSGWSEESVREEGKPWIYMCGKRVVPSSGI